MAHAFPDGTSLYIPLKMHVSAGTFSSVDSAARTEEVTKIREDVLSRSFQSKEKNGTRTYY